MKLQEFQIYLKGLFPSDKIVDYCPNGLQVEGKGEVKRVATAVSANLKTIEKAIEEGVDALIVHHGLFWQRDSYVIDGVKKKKIGLLLKHNISLFAYHLPLDCHPIIGNNWKAAYEMGWSNLEPFCNLNGTYIGVKGSIQECSAGKLKEILENYYGHPAVCALGGPEMIRSIALVSGGAHKNLMDALQAGVDAFVTGTSDEPIWPQAYEEGINFYALGHSATERVGPRALAEYIKKELKLDCQFIDVLNPF